VMLMQGTDDDAIIFLLKDEIEDSSDFEDDTEVAHVQEVPSTPAEVKSNCCACGKTVYPVERVSANNRVFHKGCFRCCTCQRVLKQTSYAFLDNKFYCEPDFERAFKKNADYVTGFKGTK